MTSATVISMAMTVTTPNILMTLATTVTNNGVGGGDDDLVDHDHDGSSELHRHRTNHSEASNDDSNVYTIDAGYHDFSDRDVHDDKVMTPNIPMTVTNSDVGGGDVDLVVTMATALIAMTPLTAYVKRDRHRNRSWPD